MSGILLVVISGGFGYAAIAVDLNWAFLCFSSLWSIDHVFSFKN